MHERALEYIRNAGGSPKIEHFDDDHAPVGPRLREDMKTANLIFERDGRVWPVGGGVAKAKAQSESRTQGHSVKVSEAADET